VSSRRLGESSSVLLSVCDLAAAYGMMRLYIERHRAGSERGDRMAPILHLIVAIADGQDSMVNNKFKASMSNSGAQIGSQLVCHIVHRSVAPNHLRITSAILLDRHPRSGSHYTAGGYLNGTVASRENVDFTRYRSSPVTMTERSPSDERLSCCCTAGRFETTRTGFSVSGTVYSQRKYFIDYAQHRIEAQSIYHILPPKSYRLCP